MENEEKRKCFIVDSDVRASRCEDRKRSIGKEDCDGCDFLDAAPPEGYEPAAPAKKVGDVPVCSVCTAVGLKLDTKKRCYKCRPGYKATPGYAGAPKKAAAEPAAPTPEPEKGDDVELIEATLEEAAAPKEPLAKGPRIDLSTKDLSTIKEVCMIAAVFTWTITTYWLFGYDIVRGVGLGAVSLVATFLSLGSVLYRRFRA